MSRQYSRTPRPPMGVDDRQPPAHPRRPRSRLVSPMRELERDPTTDSAIAEAHGAVTPALPPLPSSAPAASAAQLAGAARRAGSSATIAGREDAPSPVATPARPLLCVPDGAITEAAATITAAIPPLELRRSHRCDRAGRARPTLDAGASVFSLHPLQTIPDADADFTGCPCAIAGSDATRCGRPRVRGPPRHEAVRDR